MTTRVSRATFEVVVDGLMYVVVYEGDLVWVQGDEGRRVSVVNRVRSRGGRHWKPRQTDSLRLIDLYRKGRLDPGARIYRGWG